MSNYSNFIYDFPERCQEILKLAMRDEEIKKREVTLSLMVASTAFLIPYERLKSSSHISKDERKYEAASDSLQNIKKQMFIGSDFCKNKVNTWRHGDIYLKDEVVDPEAWPSKPVSESKSVDSVMKVLRNALAHGNIFTKTNNQMISEIVFCSQLSESIEGTKYQFIVVSPSDFIRFLDAWFIFFKENNIAYQDVVHTLNES